MITLSSAILLHNIFHFRIADKYLASTEYPNCHYRGMGDLLCLFLVQNGACSELIAGHLYLLRFAVD